jgi:hypothetical protein
MYHSVPYWIWQLFKLDISDSEVRTESEVKNLTLNVEEFAYLQSISLRANKNDGSSSKMPKVILFSTDKINNSSLAPYICSKQRTIECLAHLFRRE